MFVGHSLACGTLLREVLHPPGDVISEQRHQRQVPERLVDVLLQIRPVVVERRPAQPGQVFDVVLDPVVDRDGRELRVGAERLQSLGGSEFVDELLELRGSR